MCPSHIQPPRTKQSPFDLRILALVVIEDMVFEAGVMLRKKFIQKSKAFIHRV
jgi:hypothetical protein